MKKLDTWAGRPVEQMPLVDLTKCYFCTGKAMATCTTCKVPLCDEHKRETYGYRYCSEAITTMCHECAIMMKLC